MVVFTLFPALQSDPAHADAAGAARRRHRFERFAAWLPRFSYRWRWPLVGAALRSRPPARSALFGFPGVLAPMRLLTDPVEYINHAAPLYRDIKRLETDHRPGSR